MKSDINICKKSDTDASTGAKLAQLVIQSHIAVADSDKIYH